MIGRWPGVGGMRASWLVLLAVFVAGVARGQAGPAILDPGPIPADPPALRAGYQGFLALNLPRVFVLSRDGHYTWFGGGGTLAAARARALANCNAKGWAGCAIYAEDLTVIGRADGWAPPPGEALFGGPGFGFVADARYVWWGPGRAQGVYVWGHGYNGPYEDVRGLQPQPHVRPFNNHGYDIVRFDREAGFDNRAWAEGRLREGLLALRAKGYRRVIVGGQSRGGWNALQMLDTPGLADVVIAVSPASNGVGAGAQASLGQAEVYRMFSRAQAPAARVALVQFRDDEYEHNPDQRFAMADDLLRPHVAALLKINQPDGLSGHGAGGESRFAREFGLCLYRFATAAAAPGAC